MKAESRAGDQERLPGPLQGINEGGEHPCCTPKKLLVEIDQPYELLKSRLIRWRRKGGDGGGVLGQWRTTSGGEDMSKKLDLGDSKLVFRKPDCPAMLPTEDKNL